MRITQLELKNVGVFEDQIIEFRPNLDPEKAEIHILTGINGCGKSTTLDALASLFSPTETLQRRLRYTDSRSQIEIEYFHSEQEPQPQRLGYDNDNNFRYLNSSKWISHYRNDIAAKFDRIKNREFAFAAFAYAGSRTLEPASLHSIQELTTNPLHQALDFYSTGETRQLMQWIANTKTKVVFAQQEGKSEQAERYETSISQIENAIESIIGLPVRFEFNYEPLSVQLMINGQAVDFDLLSDGVKSIISWIADLLMRLDRLKWVNNVNVLERNFILFLDEIEIHLHPAWQREILPVIQTLFKNAQIFIATHSPFVVASVGEAWVYRFDVVDGQSHLVSVDESKAGSSYVTVLDETFGIDELFDPLTEDEFDEFDRLKKQVLSGDKSMLPDLVALAERLSRKSVEVQDIVGRELRQLQRLTPEELPL